MFDFVPARKNPFTLDGALCIDFIAEVRGTVEIRQLKRFR